MALFRQFFFLPSPPITEENCPDQLNRVFVVTGGYGGVGFELSKILFAHNATVYMAGRSESSGSEAIMRIKAAHPSSKGRVEFLHLDLSDLKTIKPAVETFLAKEKELHVLVNNAAVMFPPAGSLDAQGNDLQFGTNCLGHCLLYQLLRPTLVQTASSSPAGSVRVAWAASVGVEVLSPKPGGMVVDDDGKPEDNGIDVNYAQTKTGNVFLASEYAKKDAAAGLLHVAFNPGNLKTGLQRHWEGIGPTIAVSRTRTLSKLNTLTRAGAKNLTILHPPIWGAYTELFAALSDEFSLETSAAYIVPWGKVAKLRKDIEPSLQSAAEGGTGLAAKFVGWCESKTKSFA